MLRAAVAAPDDPTTSGSGEPGSILDPARPSVIAGEGVVILQEVAPEGRARMDAAAFARGAALAAGERLGAG